MLFETSPLYLGCISYNKLSNTRPNRPNKCQSQMQKLFNKYRKEPQRFYIELSLLQNIDLKDHVSVSLINCYQLSKSQHLQIEGRDYGRCFYYQCNPQWKLVISKFLKNCEDCFTYFWQLNKSHLTLSGTVHEGRALTSLKCCIYVLDNVLKTISGLVYFLLSSE